MINFTLTSKVNCPEVELGQTCHIVVLPILQEPANQEVFTVYHVLGMYAIASYAREGARGEDIVLYVVPSENMIAADWDLIERAFGKIRYVSNIQ